MEERTLFDTWVFQGNLKALGRRHKSLLREPPAGNKVVHVQPAQPPVQPSPCNFLRNTLQDMQTWLILSHMQTCHDSSSPRAKLRPNERVHTALCRQTLAPAIHTCGQRDTFRFMSFLQSTLPDMQTWLLLFAPKMAAKRESDCSSRSPILIPAIHTHWQSYMQCITSKIRCVTFCGNQ